jgi:predicted dehydrogenase
MGLIHAKNLRTRIQKAELIAVGDMNAEVAKEAGRQTGVEWFPDYRKILDLPGLDAVCVVTSTDTHAQISIEAAEKGLRVFCEKPMAINLEEADRLIATVEGKKIKLQVGFMRRFDLPYVYAKRRLDEGAIGKPTVFRSISRDPFPPPAWACDPKHGGGLQLEMHIHDYDLARWMMNDEVVRIYADAECLAFPDLKKQVPEFVDNTLFILRFARGQLGYIEGSLNAKYGYDIRAEISGTEGSILIGSPRMTDVTVCTSEGLNYEVTYTGSSEIPHFAQRFGHAYVAETEHFVKTILEDSPASPNVSDGRAALQMGLAAFQSTRTGRPVQVHDIR